MKKIVRNELINSMFDFMMTVFGGISAPPSKLIVGQAYANLVEEIILFIHTIELVLSCLVIRLLVKISFSRIGCHEGGCHNHGEQVSKYVPNQGFRR